MLPYDATILGAGVVGLACAELIAQAGRSVLILERHARVAQETSSRSSGVVHAGIHYPPGSAKARLCLRGRHLLTARAQLGRLRLRRTGKLVVATHANELRDLERLAGNAAACGVELVHFDGPDVRRLEPAIVAQAALYSEASGILDPHELATDLMRSASESGATFALSTEVLGLDLRADGGWTLRTRGRDGTETDVESRWIINAAGLDADRVAALAGLDVEAHGLRQHPCKGSYFTLAPRLARSISHLVYPLPQGGGLGIHLTLDLDGGVRAGPDAEYVASRDYSIDESKREVFSEAIARFLPGIRPDDLTPAYSGIRPKLSCPGEAFRDFVIQHEAARGLPGLINLLGIESPGLTASLAIAEHVRDLLGEAG